MAAKFYHTFSILACASWPCGLRSSRRTPVTGEAKLSTNFEDSTGKLWVARRPLERSNQMFLEAERWSVSTVAGLGTLWYSNSLGGPAKCLTGAPHVALMIKNKAKKKLLIFPLPRYPNQETPILQLVTQIKSRVISSPTGLRWVCNKTLVTGQTAY